ncbi:dipeptide ABC transporter ATP-binding protein [Actinokineospora bangkokensis]|uniref:ABC transporter ATP-binding protein n=1 Tax=Actinokineospora bangkokensis TaxID=1193682 RepID=A0A1Q9LMJ3_9PSEU|nr:ABC transporter ATP-binding protein [Actinokineospora bangkokensis]OLR93219.1 ABC transporter ATP-binding protein [Actinokineospora bangkokensis]
MTLLRIEGLSVAYGDHVAVEGLDLELERGRVTAVVGESGSGKSTMAHAVIGLLPGTGRVLGGSIRLDGEELVGLPEKAWRSVRGRRIGFVPQDPGVALDPTKPVGRQVGEVLRVHGLPGGPARVVELLEAAGLPEAGSRAKQYPHELSGGMRQRVLIAMATAARPALLVADEPTSALDVTVQRRILDHLEHLADTTGTAILLVTHDLAVAGDRAHDTVVMSRGRVVESGPTERVLRDPADAYTRQLLADNLSTSRPAPRPPVEDGREVLLEVRELTKVFPVRGSGLRKRHRTAVDSVSFHVRRGETLGVVGESGSGKTTTARLVLGLERATSGSVRLGGTEITTAGRAELRQLHRRVQLVYQNPYASLNPRFTVRQILTEPLRNFGVTDGPTVAHLLDSVALPAGTADRKAGELSGGQRQRVAIARALSLDPELVVCDEPVSALDVTVQAQILDLLVRLQRERGLSYLFISHDLAVVRHVSDRVAVMRRGEVVETGPTEDVFTAARHPYTRSLLDAIPGLTEEEASWT